MRNKLMIIGAGDFQTPLIERAAQNCDLVLVAPAVDEDIAALAKSVHYLDVRNQEEILRIAKEENINGVITDQTDIPVRTVAYVAENMGLPGIGYETSKLFTDKALMDARLKELDLCRIPSCSAEEVDEALAFMEELGSSVLIKPTDSQGSRGIFECHSPEDLKAHFDQAKKFSSDGKVLAQKLISGCEFFVEGMALGGEFMNLIIGDTIYFSTLKSFSAKFRITPSNRDHDLVNRVLEANGAIIKGFGLSQGITHSEFIVSEDDGEIYLLETAARGGGVYISSDLISLATGICTEDFLINICLGRQSQLPEKSETPRACGYMAFYLPTGVVTGTEGIAEVTALPYVHRNQLYKIYKGMKQESAAEDKTSRFALIVSGDDRAQVDMRMAEIRRMLKIEVMTENGVCCPIWD